MNAGSGDEELGTGTQLLTEANARPSKHCGSQTCARPVIANTEGPGSGPDDRSARRSRGPTLVRAAARGRGYWSASSREAWRPRARSASDPQRPGQGRHSVVSTEAQTGATLAVRIHLPNTDNSAGFQIPRARPPMPGIGILRDCVTSVFRNSRKHLRAAYTRPCERPTGARGVCFSPQAGPN